MTFTKLSEAKEYFNKARSLGINEVEELLDARDALLAEGRDFEANYLLLESYKIIITLREENKKNAS